MTTHFSILGWRIPWTEEPGGLQSMGKSWTRLRQHGKQHEQEVKILKLKEDYKGSQTERAGDHM